MKFDVPGYGIVEESNACFVHFLERLTRTTGHMIQEGTQVNISLEDIPIGGTAIAYFHSGMGTSVLEIRRVS